MKWKFDYLINNLKYDEKAEEVDCCFEFYYQTNSGQIEDFESFEECADYNTCGCNR